MTHNDFLYDLLKPERLTSVVDIGANPIDGDPPYKRMLAKKLCHITGFEPQTQACDELQLKKSDMEDYYPYAIGDGKKHTLNICYSSGMSSLLETDPTIMGLLAGFREWGRIIDRTEVNTKRLDDITEVDHLDMLKIDVQGSEYMIFQNGEEKLKNAVMIQTEMSFLPLYKNEPDWLEVASYIQGLGFRPHCFPIVHTRFIIPHKNDTTHHSPVNQVHQADLVWVKDIMDFDAYSDEQLKHTAMLAHHCYGSFDLSLRCLGELEGRGLLEKGMSEAYITTFGKRGAMAQAS